MIKVNSIIGIALAVFLSFCWVYETESLTCYSCHAKTETDYCVTNPEAISSGSNTIDCSDNSTASCTILRTEFTDIPGRVVSFTRGCDENPLISNEIRTDAHYTKYYRTCKTRKCNSGDGILVGSGGNSNLPSEIIRVPAKGSGTSITSTSISLFLSFVAFGFFSL